MFTYENVVPFPTKKKYADWRENFPPTVKLHFSEFKTLPPAKKSPSPKRVEYMRRFIIIHGLCTAILVDDQNAVIAGHDVLKKARKGAAWGSYAFIVPLKTNSDKWALAQAYKDINQGKRGESV